MLLAGINPIFC
jgi:hypothetical protein